LKYSSSVNNSENKIHLDISNDAANDVAGSKGTLIIPLYKNNIVLAYHPKKRGWEFPVGQKENEETLKECAIRKAFEDTGAILKDPKPIGYYLVFNDKEENKIAIFISDIERFEPKPRSSETDVVKIFDEITDDITFSDSIYSLILEKLEI